MKELILLAALGDPSYEIPEIAPIAPISNEGHTTIWRSGDYTYIDEPRGQTSVFQNGNFTYITPPSGNQTVCQTIGKFTYCN